MIAVPRHLGRLGWQDPDDQAADGLAVDAAFLTRVEGLSEQERRDARPSLFGTERDLASLLRMRLGEHALHTWEVAVALDGSAVLSGDAVALMIDHLDEITAMTGKSDALSGPVRVHTTDPARRFRLGPADGALRLEPDDATQSGPLLELPAEAFVRLAYGRLDTAHTPALDAESTTLEALRAAFPGA